MDEIQVFVHPNLIGTGLPVAAGLLKDIKLCLKDTQAFDTGLVKLTYDMVNEAKGG